MAKFFCEIRASLRLVKSAHSEVSDVLNELQSSFHGLSETEAALRLSQYGPNVIAHEQRRTWMHLLGLALVNPLVVLLFVLAVVSFLTHDISATILMLLMIVLGVTLRFVQEYRADKAAAKLKAMIRVTATVIRDDFAKEVPLATLVPGDIIRLSAGDMVPADVRLLTSKTLFITQSSLTGESMPVEKIETIDQRTDISPIELTNICFLGTSVETGTAVALVVATGKETYLDSMSRSIVQTQVETSFDKGISKFTWLMIRFMLIMAPLVFLINGLSKHDWTEAFFFALAVAVGLTPEMMPMIVTVCLSKGAIVMSRKKVIVKKLHSMQNFGAMDVLCTDKTGTLTLDHIIIVKHCNVMRKEEADVMSFAYINSHFQTGLKNVLDRAILEHAESRSAVSDLHKVDEIPFDFARKLMSVVVASNGACRIITKGAPEEVFKRCTHFELEKKIYPIEQKLVEELRAAYEQLNQDGFRVLAIAYKDLPRKADYTREDECDMTLRGYIAFLDPPKETARPTLEALKQHGVQVKILTGDNEIVSRKICREVGLNVTHILSGSQVETMSDEELSQEIENVSLFARLSPAHKQKIIRLLQKKGHTVGFLGDGINDAPALRAADVGISVDSAVDIAKESADVILLEKSLLILEEGVIEGRKVFVNILKYIRMGASSNFGNMLSVIGASIFLPFLPMTPLQIITNSLLYDFSQIPIPTDEVDPEQIKKPRPWSIKEITRFILFIGPISSIFDYTTFGLLLWVFGAWNNPALFQTGWFVESLLTQTLVIHVIRTNRIPFLQSWASLPLLIMSLVVIMVGAWLPYSPIAPELGLRSLPSLYWPLVVLTLICYTFLTQIVKVWLLRKKWI